MLLLVICIVGFDCFGVWLVVICIILLCVDGFCGYYVVVGLGF